jgi:hypothetical protein
MEIFIFTPRVFFLKEVRSQEPTDSKSLIADLEYWSVGVLEKNTSSLLQFLSPPSAGYQVFYSQYPVTPLLQYSGIF